MIEFGTVNRAAEALFISQPAVSKLLSKLEEDTGLKLFERVKGKLAPTPHGMRLYEEIDRIFVGLHQLEGAVDSIRRDERRQLRIGTMPALSGSFVRRVTMEFFKTHPGVQVSIHSRSSQFLADWLVARQIDVALVSNSVENPYLDREPILSSPLFCALPPNHVLAKQRVIRTRDLNDVPFVTFEMGSLTDKLVKWVFNAAGAHLNPILNAVTAPTVCEFVAAGLGVSLVHPLFAEWVGKRIVLRRFEPELISTFQLCRVRATRNESLVEAYMGAARRVAQQVSDESFHGS